MRQKTKVDGTRIAQAAKDLEVTSVTIRRYISEFNIDTTTDKNGIKVLPADAMDELKEVRRLKEDGLTNSQVLEALEDQRSKPKKKTRVKKETKAKIPKDKDKEKDKPKDKDKDKDEEEKETKKKAKTKTDSPKKRTRSKKSEDDEKDEAPKERKKRRSRRDQEEEAEAEEADTEEVEEEEEQDDEPQSKQRSGGRLKHTLTCQTCGKTFEHLNPRLRDCLDCYRSKRKERRRGGDRHKNVIQHPLAQQVASKMANQQQGSERPHRAAKPVAPPPKTFNQSQTSVTQPIIGGLKTKVRSYRKAIDETRHITSSLKRRLERPDLPEGDRRWLEQIYAYQLILHQGWRHLAEYRSNTNAQQKQDD